MNPEVKEDHLFELQYKYDDNINDITAPPSTPQKKDTDKFEEETSDN